MAAEAVRLHLGCGADRWDGWVNVDRQAGPAVDLVCDMRRLGDFFEPGSCDAIHLMHAINYLTLWEARAFFATCRALLRPGGELVIETVDAAKAATRLLEAMGKDFAAYLEGIRAFPGFGLDHLQQQEAYTGYSMAWTPWHMQQELQAAGFARSEIRAPLTHASWRDFRCEAFVAAAAQPVAPSERAQLLFVVDEEAGHVTAHLRARLFVAPLARRGIDATVVNVRDDVARITALAARADIVIATKVRSVALLRQIKAVARGPVLFDFTDALWLPQHQRFGWQELHAILAEADALLCDNSVIADYGRRHNANVFIWPVCSSVEQFDDARASRAQRAAPAPAPVRLGWVGSRGTAPALHAIADALAAVARVVPNLELRVLGCAASGVPTIPGLPTTTVPTYDEAAMIEEVLDMDIGLFPAPSSMEDYRNRGPLKGLIYMSAGVPMVCERGGTLDDIVVQGVNGYVATGTDEWAAHLTALATDAAHRTQVGAAARAAMDFGSLESVTDTLCEILVQGSAVAPTRQLVPAEATSAPVVASVRKPRVLIIADVPGWIFERHARTLQARLAGELDITIAYRGQEYVESEFDLIYPLEYDLVPPHWITMPWKYVTSLRSHISWDGVPASVLSGYLDSHYQQVHVVSRRLRELFATHLPGVAYVTHGIDLSRFTPVPRHAAPGTPLVVGWAGNRLSPAKGFDEFIRPLGKLPGVSLELCGYSDVSHSLDEMPAFYAGLDVYICSSSSEGNNNALLEAAASGCAIVTTDNGTVPEYLVDGQSALIVPRTAAAFRDAVVRLRDDASLRARIGSAAVRAVAPAWGWDARIAEYRAFLLEALAGRDSARARMSPTPSATEHAAAVNATLAALHQSLSSGDSDRAAAAVVQLVSLDPTKGEFRKLVREVQTALARLAA